MSASPSSQLRVIMTFLSLPGAGSKMWTFESLRDGGWALDGNATVCCCKQMAPINVSLASSAHTAHYTF